MKNGSDSPVVANQINSLCTKIAEECNKIDDLGKAKAAAQSEYEGKVQEMLYKLTNKVPVTDSKGNVIEGCPATTAKDIAKGLVVEARFKMDIAEINYKSCITKIDSMKAVLNAKQSIFRHLSET